MIRQLYMRPVNWKPPCRRALVGLADNAGQVCQGRPLVCIGTRLVWLDLEPRCCPVCQPGDRRQEGQVSMCPLPTKAMRESLTTSSGSNVKRSSMFDSFPEIWAFLTCLQGPDGSPRQTGTMSLSLNGGIWNLALNDPATGLYAAMSSASLDDLVLMIESRMAEGTMPWKLSKYPPRKGK